MNFNQPKIMNLQQLLAGKKTYLVALAAIAYVLGAHLGWWTFDDKILDALGFGGLITLRAGVKKAAAAALPGAVSSPTPGEGTRPTDVGPMPSSGAPAPKAAIAGN